jgi:hypothetical protein
VRETREKWTAMFSATDAIARQKCSRRADNARVWVLGVVLLLGLTISPAPGNGQERFQVHGYVQWIGGNAMQLQTDGGASISLDLSQLDQGSYQTLTNGNGVTVTGVVVRPESSVQATTLLAESIVAD